MTSVMSRIITNCEERKENKRKIVTKLFTAELGWEPSRQEIDDYIELFEEGKTNFFLYSDMLKTKAGVPNL